MAGALARQLTVLSSNTRLPRTPNVAAFMALRLSTTAAFRPLAAFASPLSPRLSLHHFRTMGVTREVIRQGTGPTPKPGDKVSIHYVGTLSNGKKFDSSRDRGSPFECIIGVGQVIRGWDEGVTQMKVGEKSNLICSPEYAYGSRSVGGIIPANSTLHFEVELLDIL
ncbi:FK506 binding protein proline rotamase rapamycin-binding protein [Dimargaris verticillata]|uniref:peptidylprolyl isomerase n=1 Tax=Dimargaris verticillata TaxID=2761393 RepID=A0A9W8B706_9FUNG|nr:FK506 binding protein proline rotamase rapamycin-binding protein [Dimargaris verticillata]